MNPAVKIQKLANGLTVIVEEMPLVHSAAVGFLVGFGSKHEQDFPGGLAHYVEHMLFKGTLKRTPADIAEQIDSVGGRINAHTSKEYTSYYAVVLDEHFDLALDILSDMYLNSAFAETEIERERNVILEEIKMYDDSPDEKIHDLACQNIWDGHILGNPIIGTEKSVRKIARADILSCIKNFYTPDNTIIAVAGNVKAEEVIKQIESKFDGFRGKVNAYTEPPIKITPGIKIVKKDTEQVHLCLSTKGVSYQSGDRFTLSLLSSILGGSMSSRLFQKVREQKGLVYSIYTYPTFYKNAGLFTLYVGTQLKNTKQVLDISLKELTLVKQNGITPIELQRAKEQVKGHLVLNLEDSSSRMSWLLKSLYNYGAINSVEEIMHKVEAVSGDDIQRLANEIFIKEDLQLTAIGNFAKTNFFQELDC
ncbi:putative Zn-dependent peptidases [Candidatus Termititenax dinenymphae]|uniref:Zn-dependent peptidases n=1 Tax=Candidatus Termititenax dinenymphae TaxID=2218523 RepID=A0A388TJY9_9BACT|nr:putative Zn-dependent peptidases [Candidatus Termititenax dinenymphae]